MRCTSRNFNMALSLAAFSFLAACASGPKVTETPTETAFVGPPHFVPKLTWPVNQGLITDIFGRKRGHKIHKGLDIARGHKTLVFAAEAGKVTYRGYEPGYGRYVELQHANGWITRYAHLNQYKVRWNQEVERGQLLGLMGRTGRASGVHLHFEVRHNNQPKNPLAFLPPPEESYRPDGFGTAVSIGESLMPIQSIRTSSLRGPIFWLRPN